MRFGHILFLIIAIAIIEMYLLIAIGSEVGALTTIALVFITAAVGIWMLRQQSFATLSRAFMSVQRGEEPVREFAEAPFLLIGAVLLLLPGFFTDAIGFLCLLPWTRRAMLYCLTRRAVVNAPIEGQVVSDERLARRTQARIIEGEWRQEDK